MVPHWTIHTGREALLFRHTDRNEERDLLFQFNINLIQTRNSGQADAHTVDSISFSAHYKPTTDTHPESTLTYQWKQTAHFNSSDVDRYLFYKQTPVSPACLVYGHLSPQLSEKGLSATESELLLCVIRSAWLCPALTELAVGLRAKINSTCYIAAERHVDWFGSTR